MLQIFYDCAQDQTLGPFPLVWGHQFGTTMSILYKFDRDSAVGSYPILGAYPILGGLHYLSSPQFPFMGEAFIILGDLPYFWGLS